MSELLTPLNDYDVIRAMFAEEENLSPKEALLRYPERRLEMAKQADERLYAKWVEDAYQWQKRTHAS